MNAIKSTVDQDVRMAMYSILLAIEGGVNRHSIFQPFSDIPWIPKEGYCWLALWPKYLRSDREPLAPVPSGENVPSFCLIPKLERLSGIPVALVYLGFLGDPNRFTGYQPRIACLVLFGFSEGCRDPCLPVDHLVCY